MDAKTGSQTSPLLAKWQWVSGGVCRVFFVVFAAVFGVLFLEVVFFNMHFSYSPLWVLLCALCFGGLFYGLYRLCCRAAGFLQKRQLWCLGGFFVLLAATQVLFYWQVAAYPTRDFERIFTGAVNYTVNGFIQDPYLDYFYKYPNNMPLTILLQFVFRVFHRVGFDNFYLVGALLTAGCTMLTYLFVYLCCKRLFGVKWGFFALGLLYLCLPLQSYISIFYTDMLTMLFAPFGVYCYLRLRDAQTWKGRLTAAAVLCAGLGFGTKIKYSVVITLVAILVDFLLRGDWKKLLVTAGLFLAFFAAFSALFNSYMYAHFLEEDIAKDAATPFTAWIMMALVRDGTHDPDDNYLIWQWPTQEEKQAQAMATLKERLGAYTPGKFLVFLNQKSVRSFGSGNLDYTHAVADSPMRQTFLVEGVSENGRHFAWFDTLNQGYYVALFALIIAGAVLAARRRDYTAFVPYLAIFGLFLFLLLWEAGQRYLINYYAMFILAGTFGMQQLMAGWPALARPGAKPAAESPGDAPDIHLETGDAAVKPQALAEEAQAGQKI